MISFIKIIFLIWIITGLIALAIGTRYMNKPENRKALYDQIKEVAQDLKLKDEDCICIMYVGFVLLGFVGASIMAFRRLKNRIRRDK